MFHLEDLIAEYNDWLGYLIKRNVKVGHLKHGGWEMELDVIAYHPGTNHLMHIEPSIDALAWPTRQVRYKKKFSPGKKYIFKDIFPSELIFCEAKISKPFQGSVNSSNKSDISVTGPIISSLHNIYYQPSMARFSWGDAGKL